MGDSLGVTQDAALCLFNCVAKVVTCSQPLPLRKLLRRTTGYPVVDQWS